jgi:hypothetical protein
LVGALVAMILAEIAFGALAWYLDSIADFSRIYNTAGAVFALLTWLYALATVFFSAQRSAPLAGPNSRNNREIAEFDTKLRTG